MALRKFIPLISTITKLDIRHYASYVQGQSPEPKLREYFYYIDHHGQLFLDDSRMKNFTSCFKDKDFLVFFFNRLRKNETDRYSDEFPYVSLCGRERNFIRCDDTPIVYTNIVKTNNGRELLTYCNAGERLSVPFAPEKICMNKKNGRVYYPADEKYGGYALVKSAVADQLSLFFVFDDGQQAPPTRLKWNNVEYKLTNEIAPIIKDKTGVKAP